MLRLKKGLTMDQGLAEEEPDSGHELLKRTMSMMRLRKNDNAALYRPVRGPSMMRLKKQISQLRLKKAGADKEEDYECLWNPTVC